MSATLSFQGSVVNSGASGDDLLVQVQVLVDGGLQEPVEALSNLTTEQIDLALAEAGKLLASAQSFQAGAIHALFEARALRGIDGLATLRTWLSTSGGNLPPAFIYRMANRVAWISRGRETPDLWQGSDRGDLFVLYVGLSERRYFFDVRAMDRILRALPAATTLMADPIVRALQAFVVIRDSKDVQEVRAAKRAVLDSQLDGEIYAICADVVAHAVWLNHDLQEQGKLLEEICRDWLDRAGRATSVMQFRFAAAMRLQGRYGEAVARVEDALSKLHGSGEFVRTFSEQCVRERELSVAGLSLQQGSDQTRELVSELETNLRQGEQRSTARTIEIITLFSAVASFGIAGGASATSGTGTAKEKLVVLAGFGSALATFTLLVILVMAVTSATDQTRKYLGLGLSILLVIGAQFGLVVYASQSL